MLILSYVLMSLLTYVTMYVMRSHLSEHVKRDAMVFSFLWPMLVIGGLTMIVVMFFETLGDLNERLWSE